jgi:hypothetical protein
MTPPDEQRNDDEDARQRANLMALAAVVALVVGSIWLVLAYRDSAARMNCFLMGRRNCAPAVISR